jgi:hypothetical protein
MSLDFSDYCFFFHLSFFLFTTFESNNMPKLPRLLNVNYEEDRSGEPVLTES